jgi:uncharacterized OsmC-like protein
MLVTPSFVMSGSILAGTAEHRLEGIETSLEITADAEPEKVAAIVDQAERMCFVLDALQRSHSVSQTASLNGQPL